MNEVNKDRTEFKEPNEEEQIINTARIFEIISFYKIPLVFAVLALFLLGGVILLWQSNNRSAKVMFSQELFESATTSSKIKVDIEGSVVNPGVYELLSGSRIQDLLVTAGGLAGTADREWVAKNLNQAAKLIDGGKIYIPSKNTTNTTNTSNNLININAAYLSELDQLPGVGPVTAQKIIDGRPYQSIEELVTKKIVGQTTFEKIKNKISL